MCKICLPKICPVNFLDSEFIGGLNFHISDVKCRILKEAMTLQLVYTEIEKSMQLTFGVIQNQSITLAFGDVYE